MHKTGHKPTAILTTTPPSLKQHEAMGNADNSLHCDVRKEQENQEMMLAASVWNSDRLPPLPYPRAHQDDHRKVV